MTLDIGLPKLTLKKVVIGSIAILVSFPIFVVLFQVVHLSSESWYHLTQNLIGTYTINTLIVVSGVSFLSLIIGVPSAWFVSNYDFPFRRSLELGLMLPLAIPAYINGVTYSGLTDYTGLIRVFFRDMGWGDIKIDILNEWGVIFVMGTVLFPYIYLSTRTVFRLQSNHQLEAATLLQNNSFRIFFQVALPLAWPGIFAGLMLVIMEVLNDYGTVHYFGVSTFTTGIFKSWLSLGDLPSGVLLSLFLMIFVIMLMVVESRIRRSKSFSGGGMSHSRIKINGFMKWFAMISCTIPFVLGFLIPVFQMIYWAVLSWDRVNWNRLSEAVAGTVKIGLVSTLLLTVLTFFFSFLKRSEGKSKLVDFFSRLAGLGYSMPAAVMGIGVLVIFLFFNPQWLFVSTNALIFGLMTRFFAVAQNPLSAAYEKIPISLDETAQILNRATKIPFLIHLPILKSAILSAFILVFIDVIKELPMTLILRPFNFETLAALSFQFAKDDMTAQSAIPSLMIVSVAVFPVFFLHRIFDQRE